MYPQIHTPIRAKGTRQFQGANNKNNTILKNLLPAT